MADVTQILQERFADAIAAAVGEEHRDADPILRPSGNPKFGDFQANLAMSLGKQLGKKPRDLAQAVVEKLDTAGVCSDVEVAGPGFINLTLEPAFLAEHAAAMLGDDRLGVVPVETSQRVVVDYSSPNVAKEMHVGHLRSTVIGDAIVRVLEAVGHDVTRQNHLGDWGTQFGMLIEHILDEEAGGSATLENAGQAELTALYQRAKQRFDEEPEFAERAKRRVVALQRGDEATLARWRKLIDLSTRYFQGVYERLGVRLTPEDVRGESFYNDKLASIVGDLEQAGLLLESEGAQVVYPEGFVDREGEAMPMIVRKSDGGYLYATTDLAAARYRVHELGSERIVYVTDARQSRHFAMVFQTLRQAGWAGEDVRLDHVAFGTVLGPDRKPFKTREGGIVRLVDLIDEAERRAAALIAEKDPELDAEQRTEVAHRVGVGGLKYADLATDRVKDYVFEFDRMLALDGNTAPYLQNAYVRIRSIFRKGGIEMSSVDASAIRVTDDAERQLVLKLLQWPDVVQQVADSLEPHRLCTLLYELASSFHSFYERCPVLIADTEELKQSRLALSALTAHVLERGLGLLGIETVERM
jgi:arginyl-tRNA synthetase